MAFGIDWLLPSGFVSIDNGRPELVPFSYSDSSRTADEWLLGQGRFLWNISLYLFVSPSYHPSFSGATSTAPFHHLHPSCFTVSIAMFACAHIMTKYLSKSLQGLAGTPLILLCLFLFFVTLIQAHLLRTVCIEHDSVRKCKVHMVSVKGCIMSACPLSRLVTSKQSGKNKPVLKK